MFTPFYVPRYIVLVFLLACQAVACIRFVFYNGFVTIQEAIKEFDEITAQVDWEDLRREYGFGEHTNLRRNLLIRFLLQRFTAKELEGYFNIKEPTIHAFKQKVRYKYIERRLGLPVRE